MNDSIPILRASINRPTTINVSGFTARDQIRFITETNQALIAGVIKAIRDVFLVNEKSLMCRSRKGWIAWPRQIAMSLAYRPPEVSLSDVGHHFGGRGHSAVLHAIRRVKERCETDPKCREQFERVKGMMK